MTYSDFMQETLDRKSLWLRARKKLMLLPLGLALGALLGFGIYTGYVKLTHREMYSEVSKLYIDFAVNGRGDEADYFNGATWTDLLTAHPLLWDRIEEGLSENYAPEELGGSYIDFVQKTVKAEILSDVRLMTLTVTTPYRDTTQVISDIVCDALVSFGNEAKEFDRIEYLSEPGGVRPVLLHDRSRNAALLGGVLGLLAAAAFLHLSLLLDDAVYVPEEAERRYSLPVLSCTAKKPAGESGAQDLCADGAREGSALSYFLEKHGGKAAVVSPLGKEKAEAAVDALPAFGGALTARDAGDHEALREAGCVIAALPYGVSCGAAFDRLRSGLAKQDCPVEGLLLQDADEAFLRRYYLIKDGKA